MADPAAYQRSYSFRAFPDDRQNVRNLGFLLDKEFDLLAGISADITERVNGLIRRVVVVNGSGSSGLVDGVLTICIPFSAAPDLTGPVPIYAPTPIGANLAEYTTLVFCIGGSTWSLWAPSAPPAGGVPTAVLVPDASGRWWRKIPAEGGGTAPNPSPLIATDGAGNVVTLTDGVGNPITLTLEA